MTLTGTAFALYPSAVAFVERRIAFVSSAEVAVDADPLAQ
jgi:hypothetical protein